VIDDKDITSKDWLAAHEAARDDRVQMGLLGRDLTPFARAIAQARAEGYEEARDEANEWGLLP
jgi:hypothetical protein